MMRFFRVLILLLLITSGSLVGQTPQLASLEGTTVKAGSNEPVPRARVTLVQQNPQLPNLTPVTILSDETGRFAFSNVPAGPYILTAARDGYVRASYGTDKPTAEIVLPGGQAVKNIVLTMTPAGAIAGRIRNSYGEPMGNVFVRAERYVYQEGYKVLEHALTVMTNDLGDYRLYFLQPGSYVVSASPDNGPVAQPDGTAFVGHIGTAPGNPFGRPKNRTASMTLRELAALGVIPSADSGETYRTAYYPGGSDPSLATPIELRPGADHTNVDFVVTAERALRIRGRITNIPAGMRVGDASVLLMSAAPGGHGWLMEIAGRVFDSGEFEFRGVSPGTYDLVATLGDLPDDISFETAPAPAFVGANGAFTITGVVPGRYQIEISHGENFKGVGAAYIKSAELGGLDALNPTLVINDEPRGELQIVIASARGTVAGIAVDGKQNPVSGATIVLVPDIPRRQHFDLYETTKTNEVGKATLVLVPGDYTAYAFEEIQNGAWWDSDVMQKYQGSGRSVRISQGNSQSLELRVIPRP